MQKYNKEDLYRYEGERCNLLLVQLRYVLFTPGFQYSYCFRHVQNSGNKITRLWWKFWLRRMMFRSGIQIPSSTKIGPGLKIGHFGNIVVNPGAVIGKNFNIANGCLIGNAQGKKAGVPTIGNNVCMSANSSIIGGVHIGDDVMIAPGSLVNFDVPDNSIVIGNPGRIIQKESSPTKKYIVYPLK